MFDLLLAPLQALLNSLGSGALPDGGPSDQLRTTSGVLDDVHAKATTITRELAGQWHGGAAATAVEALQRNGTQNVALSERGADIAAVTDTATGIIRVGYSDLGRVVESFSAVTRAGGPALLTPMGLPFLLQSAQEHLTQGLKVIGQVRTDLESETKKLQAVAQAQANDEQHGRNGAVAKLQNEVTGTSRSSTDATTVAQTGGVQVTLPNGKVVTAPNAKAAAAVRAALTQQGVPYVWGGTTPGKGLDCSGLTQYSYRQAGLELPRVAQSQNVGARIPESQAMAGDLVVWDGHVAMALGDGTLIEAGDPVSISPMRTDNIGMGYVGIYRALQD